MIYVFDIDGTICNNTDGNYEQAEPFSDRVKKINNLSVFNKLMVGNKKGIYE